LRSQSGDDGSRSTTTRYRGCFLAGREGEAIPFKDGSVDTLTISFGIRNVTHLEAAISEMHRVLKPGGRLLCLEFSKPHWLIRPFYDVFSFVVIPVSGLDRPGAGSLYLSHRIDQALPDQEAMTVLFRKPASPMCATAISVSASPASILVPRACRTISATSP